MNPDNRLGFPLVASSPPAPVTSENPAANTHNGPWTVHVVTPPASLKPPYSSTPVSLTTRPASSSFAQNFPLRMSAEPREGVDEGRGRGSSWGDGDCSGERLLKRSGNVRRNSADDVLDRGSGYAPGDQSFNTRRNSATKISCVTGGVGGGDVRETVGRVSKHGERCSERSANNPRISPEPAAADTISTYRPATRLRIDSDDQRGAVLKETSSSAVGARVECGAGGRTGHERSGNLGGPAGESDMGETGGVITQPLLLEHPFFRGLPGWGGPGTDGAWDESKLTACSLMSPELRHVLDLRHFDPK